MAAPPPPEERKNSLQMRRFGCKLANHLEHRTRALRRKQMGLRASMDSAAPDERRALGSQGVFRMRQRWQPQSFFALGLGMALLWLAPAAFAQSTMLGGTGFLRVQSAEAMLPGQMNITAHGLGFVRARSTASVLIKDFTLNTSLTFAFSETFEVTAGMALYQDDGQQLTPMPGDTRLGLKVVPFRWNTVRLGLYPMVVLPTAEYHNVPFEPYSSGKTAAALLAVTTFDLRRMSPVAPLKVHLNLGYIDHDLTDRFFTARVDQALIGVGIKVPVRSSYLFTEYTAEMFLNHPSVRWYHNSQRLTQGIRFLGPWSLVCDVALDVSLARRAEVKDEFHKDYADWKLVLGASRRVTVFRQLDKKAREARLRQLEAQREAERLRQRREQAAREMEAMKKELEKPEKP